MTEQDWIGFFIGLFFNDEDEKGIYVFCINKRSKVTPSPTFLVGKKVTTFVLLETDTKRTKVATIFPTKKVGLGGFFDLSFVQKTGMPFSSSYH